MNTQEKNIIKIIKKLNKTKDNTNRLLEDEMKESFTSDELIDNFLNILIENRIKENYLLIEARNQMRKVYKKQ